MKSGIILQQAMSNDEYTDMLRLTHMRHTAYARAWDFDFWAIYSDILSNMPQHRLGGWGKIELIRMALVAGYPYVVWLDADAAVLDFNVDLRDALKDGGLIGACKHDAPWFKDANMPVHINSGVMYFKNDPRTLEFVNAWAETREEAIQVRFLEQGAFNRMIEKPEWAGVFSEIPARWNATVRVNEAKDEVVRGWHGVFPLPTRMQMMRQALCDDWYKYRV